MKISIPWQHLTSKNAKFVNRRRGSPRLSAAYKNGKEAIHLLAKKQVKRKRPYNKPVHVDLKIYMPDNRRRDVHNYIQQIADALEGVVYTNDWFAKKWTVERMTPDRENPRAELVITPLRGAA